MVPEKGQKCLGEDSFHRRKLVSSDQNLLLADLFNRWIGGDKQGADGVQSGDGPGDPSEEHTTRARA